MPCFHAVLATSKVHVVKNPVLVRSMYHSTETMVPLMIHSPSPCVRTRSLCVRRMRLVQPRALQKNNGYRRRMESREYQSCRVYHLSHFRTLSLPISCI